MSVRLLPAILLLPSLLSQGVRTTVYTDVDGLPSAEILDLECGPDGSLWSVGRGGVSVFDGRSWSSAANRFEFPIQDCAAIDIDPQGRVWIAGGTFSKGLAMLPTYRRGVGDEDSWMRHRAPQGFADELVHLMLALDDAGDGRVVVVLKSGKVQEYVGGGWRTLASRAEWGEVFGMAGHGDRVYCATSMGVRVLERSGESALLELPGLRPGSVRGIHVEGGGPAKFTLWTIGEDGLCVHEGAAFDRLEPDVPPRLFDVGAVRAHVRPSGDRVFYGTEQALLRRAEGSARVLGVADGLVEAGCTDIEVDRVGNTWVASRRGITRIPPPRFANVLGEDGLLGQEVTALAELLDGSLVAGHTTGISRLVDGAAVETRELDATIDTPRRRVLDLFADASGDLWIASTQAGVTRLGVDGTLRSWSLPNPTGIPGGGSANSVVRDGKGTLWACGIGGVVRFEGEVPVSVFAEGPSRAGRRMFVTPDGRVAIATFADGVLLATADGGWRRIRHAEQPAANSVYALHWTAAGELLVGTRAGLFVARGDLLERPDEGPALEGPVYFLVDDDVGRLWAGTDRGVVRFDEDGARRYTIYEGLAGQETNRAAGLVDRRGHVWIGTTGGLSRYQESEDTGEPAPPSVSIRSVEVDGRRADPADLDVVPGAAALVFRLHVVSLDQEPRVAVRFRLDGYEKSWSSMADDEPGAIRYTRLPAGTYRLLVQARSPSGAWGKVEESRPFRVPRPVWAQGWFLALTLLTVLSVGFAGHRLRGTLRRTSRLSAELEGLEHSYRYAFRKSRAPQVLLEAGSHRVLDANPRALELLEARPGSLVESGLAHSAGVDAAPLADGLAAAERDGDALFTLTAVGDDPARTRRYELLACAVDLPGLHALQVTIHDVTERRRIEEALARDQRLKSLGRLSAGIAHDFNNLLTVILGQADLALRRDPAADDASEELRDILDAGERGAQLVRQLSAFGRKQALEAEVLDLNEVLREFERMLGRILGEEVQFDLRLVPEPAPVLADRVQLERVLFNLAVNARDAMPGGGTVVIETAVERDEVVLTFVDVGVGMTEDVRERAFEPFFTTKGDDGGTGLGLATVYGVVQQSGGQLAVRSEPGVGTEIEVRLPRAELTVSEAEPGPNPPVAVPASMATRGSVLYVEDDDVVRAAGARMLRGLGYRVEEAPDGLAALDALREGSVEPDVLVTDIALPHFDGRELARLVRRARPRLPVLFVSGHVIAHDAQEGWGERARFLAKPFRAADLERELELLFDGAASVPTD